MPVTTLPLGSMFSSNYVRVEAYPELPITDDKIRDAVEKANTPEKRQAAAERLPGALSSDRATPPLRYELNQRTGAQSLGLGSATIDINNYSTQQSLVDERPNHYRSDISKNLYQRFYLGGDRWDEEQIEMHRANVRHAHLTTFDIDTIPLGRRYVFYAYLKALLKSQRSGYCVVSALPKPALLVRLSPPAVRLRNQESNRVITQALYRGSSRNIGSLASSSSGAPSVATTDTATSDFFANIVPEQGRGPNVQEWLNTPDPRRTPSVRTTITAATILPPRRAPQEAPFDDSLRQPSASNSSVAPSVRTTNTATTVLGPRRAPRPPAPAPIAPAPVREQSELRPRRPRQEAPRQSARVRTEPGPSRETRRQPTRVPAEAGPSGSAPVQDERPLLNTLNTLLMRRGDGSSGKCAINTILYAFGILPMRHEEFPDEIAYGQRCEHYPGPSVAELIEVARGKGLEARPHDPEKIRESGIDSTKGFILLKPFNSQLSHYVGMVRSEVTGRFHVSDSADQDSAMNERYSPIANNALNEYQRAHNVTIDGAITFHQQSQ